MTISKLAFSIVLLHFPAIGDKWISRRVRSSPGRWKNPRRELIKHLCRRTSDISGLIGLWCPWACPAWTIRAYGQVTVFVVSSQILCSGTVFLAIVLLFFLPVQKGPLSSSLKHIILRHSSLESGEVQGSYFLCWNRSTRSAMTSCRLGEFSSLSSQKGHLRWQRLSGRRGESRFGFAIQGVRC